MEKKTIDVIVGQKVEEDVDPSKVQSAMDKPIDGEVEGHSHYENIECPYNGEIYRYLISDDTYQYYRCGGCGKIFRK